MCGGARRHWAQCGTNVEQQIDLREGDLLETLKDGLPEVDLLLLDSGLIQLQNCCYREWSTNRYTA